MGGQTLLTLVLAAFLVAADAPSRKWTDSTGQFSIEASMVDLQNGAVHLKRADGKIIVVPLRQLSQADQEFVRQTANATSGPASGESSAVRQGCIRLPLFPFTFQRKVSLEAMDSDGTAQAKVVLADHSRPGDSQGPRAISSFAFQPATEGYYLGLVGLPESPNPIVELTKGEAKNLRVGCVEVIAVHEGGKLTIRIVSNSPRPLKKDDSLVLLRPGLCSTAQLRSIAEFVPVVDQRASSLGLDSEAFLCLERSAGNVHRIVRAVQQFHQRHGYFPPAVVYGPDGKAWHSWRVLILPYLDERMLYEQYRFDEPWDGPNNSRLLTSIPEVYRDPIHGAAKTPYTHYAAIVGSVVGFSDGPRKPLDFLPQAGTAFTGGTRKMSECTDGTSNTVFLGSITPERRIPWTKPEDVVWRDNFPSLGAADGFASPYRSGDRSGGLFGFIDGSVSCISDEIDIQVFRNLLQINDGRNIPELPELRPGARYKRSLTVLQVFLAPTGDSAGLIIDNRLGEASH